MAYKAKSRYMRNLNALYGNGTAVEAPKRISEAVPTEEIEQIHFVQWLRENAIRFYSVPNGRNSAGENARFNRTGQVAGVPDVCLPIPSGGKHSLYIELKRRKGGRVSPEQREWIDWLNATGFQASLAYGCDEAIKIVKEYLGWTG